MSNRLKHESSPYLLQHSENPVDWYPWCEEAFEKSRREQKPVFLSVGYSTCHWCHVMAHESFENKEIAEILNQSFVSIKVDREERPDIDSVYMAVCQAFTGRGGWPMNIFMTAEQKPFFAGTYFPPESRSGMIGFRDLLLAILEKWENDRAKLQQSGEGILAALNQGEGHGQSEIHRDLPKQAAGIFTRIFDRQYGGFGPAPKFPTPHNLIFLILYSRIYQDEQALKQAEFTLDRMRRGGIFDQIGYGFSRYSTDAYYLVPHFEKMLYDNALLIMAYLAAYKAGGNQTCLDTAEKTADYIFREMTNEEGAFYSAQDADSEGEEGKFYVWDYEEVCRVLGEKRGAGFCVYYDITQKGNFEGKSIPNLLNEGGGTERGQLLPRDFEEERKLLYRYRKTRGKLHLDDKILTSWNSLMICAMSMLYRVTGKRSYLLAAEKSCEFIEKNLAEGNQLYVSIREGVRSVKGFLDEYAYYTAALLSLYEVTSDSFYLERAKQICEEAEQQFADRAQGGYFLSGTRNGNLITRPKETYDGAMPSGNSAMAYVLVRLYQLTDKDEYQKRAERQLAFLSGEAGKYPAGYCLFLTALLSYLHPRKRISAVLSKEDDAGGIMSRLPLYADVKVYSEGAEGYTLLNGRTTYYVCEDHTCLPPSNRIEGSDLSR